MRLVLAAALMLAPIGADAGASETLRIGAWVTYWDRDRGLARLEGVPGTVEDVFFFDGVLTPEGVPRIHADERGLAVALAAVGDSGRVTWLTLVNDVVDGEGKARLKDGEIVHRLLADEKGRRRHAAEAVDLARRVGASGLDIDYENLDALDREVFTRFVEALSESDLRLSVTVQPKSRDVRSRGPGAADWRAVCPNVDRLQIMLYNLHNAKTAPGPIATPDWIEEVLAYAIERCPRDRIIPALKLSGMDWGGDGARGIQYEEALALARAHAAELRRDEASGVPYFHYRAEDGAHTVYFEDASSLERKLGLVRSLGFDTVVLWSLGREDPEILAKLARDRSH